MFYIFYRFHFTWNSYGIKIKRNNATLIALKNVTLRSLLIPGATFIATIDFLYILQFAFPFHCQSYEIIKS